MEEVKQEEVVSQEDTKGQEEKVEVKEKTDKERIEALEKKVKELEMVILLTNTSLSSKIPLPFLGAMMSKEKPKDLETNALIMALLNSTSLGKEEKKSCNCKKDTNANVRIDEFNEAVKAKFDEIDSRLDSLENSSEPRKPEFSFTRETSENSKKISKQDALKMFSKFVESVNTESEREKLANSFADFVEKLNVDGHAAIITKLVK